MSDWLLIAILGTLFSPQIGVFIVALFLLSHTSDIVFRLMERWLYRSEVKRLNHGN